MNGTCTCGRPLLARPGDLEATCAECHNLPNFCECAPIRVGLPPLDELLRQLSGLDGGERRRRVHEVIRALADAPVEQQQEYRAAIVDGKYIGRGDWREALAEAKKSRIRSQTAALPAQRAEPEHQDALDITDEPDGVREITQAIMDSALPDIYLRGRQLVHVGVADEYVETRDLDEALLRRLIADHLLCVRQTPFGLRKALPFPNTCKAILALADWPKVPRLQGVASYPLLLPGGSILQQPGYDQASGLFLHQGVTMRPVPDRPSSKEVAFARNFMLNKYLRDFPWTSDADRANCIAAFLTPPVREIIADLFPFMYVTAPERGSGKSLLTTLLSTLFGGAVRAFPEKDEEMRKVITSILRGADAVVVFDNVDCVIKSSPLAAVLTTRLWTDRVLGGSRDGKWPNDRLWAATGTNVTLGGDFAQRSVRIAMDYGRPNPDLRSGFAIPDIARWTQEHRGDVIWAILTLARAWQVAGAPESDHIMRGFTRWARVMGGILAFHEIPGFLGNREEIRAHDEDADEWDRLLRMLRSAYGDTPRLARDILADAAAHRELEDALPSTPDGGAWTTRSLGKALAAHEGRWYGNPPLSLRSQEDKHTGTRRWRVRENEQ